MGGRDDVVLHAAPSTSLSVESISTQGSLRQTPEGSGGRLVPRVGLPGDLGGFPGELLDHCEVLM